MSILAETNTNLKKNTHDFLNRGWSIIPLQGERSAANPKAPALSAWMPYQNRQPTQREVERWLHVENHTAFGIVLGDVSGLLVLDIDTPEAAAAFEQACPDLTETFTVRSGCRGLPHYYFALSFGMKARSRKRADAELRGNGQYVVAPGTRIGEHVWGVVDGREPRLLTAGDLSRILAFLKVGSHENSLNRVKAASGAKYDHINRDRQADAKGEKPQANLTARGLVRRYRMLTAAHGRNDALFKAACFARDCGWHPARVEMVLKLVHARQGTMSDHQPETFVSREREAVRTIRSAFRRPKRERLYEPESGRGLQLPNAIREKLLQLEHDRAARLLDGLLMADVKPGQTFTAAQAYDRVRDLGIGRNAVFQTLKTRLGMDQAIFERVDSPASPLHSPTPHADAAGRCAEQINQCLFDSPANPVKSAGRPVNRYVMPSVERLCALLDVEDRGGDELKPDDLRSPRAYRAALHNALIRRAPGQYSRAWQSRRLGISEDTCRRYEQSAGVRVTPMYTVWPLTWGTLDTVLPEEPAPGQFIEDQRGRRYPPIPALARMLLARGDRIVYKHQEANDYRFPEIAAENNLSAAAATAVYPREKIDVDEAVSRAISRITDGISPVDDVLQVGTKTRMPRIDQPFERRECAPVKKPSVEILNIENVRSKSQPDDRDLESESELEKMAERLYEALRAYDSARSITRRCASEWAQTYGEKLIAQGLGVLKNRRGIRNPAGFLKTWLRGEKSRRLTWSESARWNDGKRV